MQRFAVLFCLLMAFSAKADTYEAWERGVGNETGSVSVMYVPWLGFEASDNETYEHIHGGFEGELLIHARSTPLQHLPLSVRVVCSHVQSDEIVTQTGEPWENNVSHVSTKRKLTRLISGFSHSAQVKPNAPIRETLSETETVLPALEPNGSCVRVGFPHNRPPMIAMRGSYKPYILVARYEVVDATGQVLARGIVPHLLNANGMTPSVAWVTGDVEADRLLRERCGLNTVETVTALPHDPAAYEGLRAIWVSQSVWNADATNTCFWQRLLLQGVSLYGRPETVRAMQSAIGSLPNGVMLAAHLIAPTTTTCQVTCNSRPLMYAQDFDLDLNSGTNGVREKSVLDNARSVFEDAAQYRTWTISVLGLFTIGTVVLLVLACVRLPGPKRMALWWALPLWALLFAVVGGGVGRFALARYARTDVTEYRWACLQWPEMYCQAQGRMLLLDGGKRTWNLPANAMECPVATGFGSAHPFQAIHHETRTPDAVKMTITHIDPGWSGQMVAAWFRPRALPFAVAETQGECHVVATTDLAAVYVWAKGEWRDLGSMPAGCEKNPLAKNLHCMTHLPGLPKTIASLWPENGARYAASEHTWLVVALQQIEPDMRPADTQTKAAGRVVWIVQCP